MKRLALLTAAALALVLSACAPQAAVETNVLPTLISASVDPGVTTLVLQGRYFGDGQGGMSQNSYVILGADIAGNGGVLAAASSWSGNRIELLVPEGAGSGYVFVVVDGVRSNGLPVTLR